SKLLGSATQVDILIDWTHLRGHVHALVAAVPIGGRGLPILCHVYEHGGVPTRAMHPRFLRQLACVLPPGCPPTLITDAGFQSTWMTDVASRGWRYVARLRQK